MDESLSIELPRLMGYRATWVSLSLLLRIPIRKMVSITINTDPHTMISGHIGYSRGRILTLPTVYADASGVAVMQISVPTDKGQRAELYFRTAFTYGEHTYERSYNMNIELYKEDPHSG